MHNMVLLSPPTTSPPPFFVLKYNNKVIPCLHTMPRGKALALEAADASPSGGFDCNVCHHRCTVKASELLEVPGFVKPNKKSAATINATIPLCSCEEGPAKVHCGTCNFDYCDDCDSVIHAKGARKTHARISIVAHLSSSGDSRDPIVGGRGKERLLLCPIHKTYQVREITDGTLSRILAMHACHYRIIRNRRRVYYMHAWQHDCE